MFNIVERLTEDIKKSFALAFNHNLDELTLQPTRKDFSGHYTLVMFPYLKITRLKPEESGEVLGEVLKKESELVSNYNVVKGFLNIEVSDTAWIGLLNSLQQTDNFGFKEKNGAEMMVEFSSPNTNKPLHLGHLRNNFLGYSVSMILEANGINVNKVQIINDRGIHICKSMIAWQKFGNHETPESSGKKVDKKIGDLYCRISQRRPFRQNR